MSRGESKMALAKIEKFSGLTKVAPANIEARTTESALRDATFAYEVQLLDLKNEMIHRESKLRTEYLERVNQITAGE
jgi:hypothetical protein